MNQARIAGTAKYRLQNKNPEREIAGAACIAFRTKNTKNTRKFHLLQTKQKKHAAAIWSFTS